MKEIRAVTGMARTPQLVSVNFFLKVSNDNF